MLRAGVLRGGLATGLALVAAVGGPAAAAQLRLEEALSRARAVNPEVRAAAADLEAARGRLRQAGLLPANPVVSADLARHTAPGVEQVDRGVALSQEIEVGGQRALRVAAARYEVARAEDLLADRRRTVEARVRRTFAALGAAERQRSVAADAAALAARLLEVTRRRARAGDASAVDAELAEIEVARAQQTLALRESERARAAARLASAIGAGPSEKISVAAGERGLPAPPPEETLVARALATRPDLAAARAQRARLKAQARLVHRRGWVPNPVVSAFYRQELRDEQIVGGGISIPLPLWNREQGAETALHAAAAAAAVEVDRLRREIPRQVHLALVRRARAAESWGRYEQEALPAAAAAEELVERAYARGYEGLPEILMRKDRLLGARAAAIRAWLELREAEADLLEAVGGRLP